MAKRRSRVSRTNHREVGWIRDGGGGGGRGGPEGLWGTTRAAVFELGLMRQRKCYIIATMRMRLYLKTGGFYTRKTIRREHECSSILYIL
jgi:hypothetical protein